MLSCTPCHGANMLKFVKILPVFHYYSGQIDGVSRGSLGLRRVAVCYRVRRTIIKPN